MTASRMNIPFFMFLMAALTLVSSPAQSQVPGDKHPDIEGVWDRFPPDSFSPDAVNRPPEKLFVPVLLKEPYASRYRVKRDKRAAAIAAGEPLADSSSQCRPEGMPKLMAATYPIQILQNRNQITVLAELFGQTRRIYLDEPMPNIDEIGTSYNGYATGHWSGETLVIRTTGIRPDIEFLDIPHSKDLVITERLRLASPDVLENDMTMEDPAVLAKPLTIKIRYKRMTDYKVSEYVCDNNHIIADDQGRSVYDDKPVDPQQ